MRPEDTTVTFRADLSAAASEYDATKAQTKFIGPLAAPRLEVEKAEGQFPIFRRSNFKKPAKVDRAEGGNYNRITGVFGKGTYDCVEHGLEDAIDDRKVERFRHLFDAELASVAVLRHQILMAYEQRVAALYSGAALTANKATTAWSTSATATPLDDLLTGIETIEDNCAADASELSLIIPRADFREMMATAQVVDKAKYTYPGVQPALLQPLQVAAMVGIKQVLIARSVYDSTEEGVAETNTQIWTAGIMYLALLAEPGDPLEIPSATRTCVWTRSAATIPVVESYREDKIRSDVVRMRDDTDEILQGEVDLFIYELSSDAA